MDPFISADEQHEMAQQQQRSQAQDVPASAAAAVQPVQIPSHSPAASLLPPLVPALHLASASPLSSNALASTPLSASSAASLTSASGLIPSGSASGGVVVLTSPATRLAALKAAATVWRSIGLDALRSVIDASALTMAAEEDRSTSARKALATQTKAFRALPDEAQVSQVGPMVKAYQNEVNELTRRSKAAEAAFLQLYRVLLDAPDPFPLLSDAATGLESLSATEEALSKTRATLADCEAEFTGLKNQEVSIRKLESEKRELESNLAALVARGVEERSRASEEEMAQVRRGYEEREQMLQSKLDHFREQLSASLSASNHLASMAASRDRMAAEQMESASRSDLKFLEAECERAHAEVAALNKEISGLRSAQSQQHGGAGADAATHSQAELAAVIADRARLEEELGTLQSKLDASDSAAHAASAKLEASARELAAVRAEAQASEQQLRAQIDALQAELSAAPSRLELQELQRNLAALQEIQFSSRKEDEHESASTTAAAAADSSTLAASSASSASVSSSSSAAAMPSQVLLAKTRRLESELTSLKLSHAALESAQAKAVADSTALRSQLAQAREANARLEHDLAESNSLVSEGMFKASIASATATAAAAAVSLRPNAASAALPMPPDFSRMAAPAVTHLRTPTPVGSTAPSDPAFASLSVEIPDASPMPPPSVSGAAAVASAVPLLASLQAQLAQSTSMLRIVLAQRDRYRSQLDALESERATGAADLDRAKTEAATLRKENLQLYEKLQFVKSMSGGAAGSAAASSASSSSSSSDRKMIGASSASGDIESGFGGVGSGALSRGGGGGAGGGSDSEAKYKLLYDEKLNPFAAFKAQARSEREKALSQSERVTLAVGRALFSKKSARTALFAYALVLHLLVMVVLWTHTVSSHCGKEKGGLGEHEH